MGRTDEDIAKVSDLQAEADHRAEIEQQAEKLICKGKFEEAMELLNSLNDELVKELANCEMNDAAYSGDKILL